MKSINEKIMPLTPSELDKHHFGDTDWKMNFGTSHHLFHINRLEGIIENIKFPLPPHRKTVYDFFFLTEGNSVRSKGLQEYSFGKNHFFFLPAYQISTHQFVSKDAKGFFCHFDAAIFNKLFPNHPFSDEFPFLLFSGEPIVEIQDSTKQAVENILERLDNEYISTKTFNVNLIVAYLLALFNELNALKKPTDPTVKNAALRVTEKYKSLLAQYIYQTNKVSDYASMLAVSSDHLNKCIKSTTGKTSQELLADMIILEAKVMLRQTDLSISEIAFKFSETNPSDFSRFFKSKTKQTPKDFRQLSDFA